MEKVISFNNIFIKYDDRIIYDNFKIDINLNSITCILGKSGCGKTTLLRKISEDNRFRGKISYVAQESTLIPWKTAYKNMEYVICDIYDKRERNKIINKYLDMLNIKQFKDYYPSKMSGGIKQRVNIGRALVYPYEIMLMDEPFTSLDIKTKKEIMNDFKNIQKNEQKTVIMVTHNIDECINLADYIYVIGDEPSVILEYIETKKYNVDEVRTKIIEKLLTVT